MPTNCSNSEGDLEDTVIGGLDIYVVPDIEHWNGRIDKDVRHLKKDFTGADWKALFYDVFNCPKPEPYIEGENIDEYDERYRVQFQQAIPDYPMLSRIWDMFEDVRYSPEEVKQLRDECLRAQGGTTNPPALEGLEKLIFACDEALRIGQGLFLASD